MVKRKQVHISNAADFKDGNGLWVKCHSPEPYTVCKTRAQVVWTSINGRCKVGGACQNAKPTYVGTTNGFKDFQEFAEWLNHGNRGFPQYGYMSLEENGKYWQLDKDLKVFGNKVYSPDTCIFVPARVNSLLVSCAENRGPWALGVHFHHANQRFESKCRDNRVSKYLGYFDSELEAHQAWQRYKIDMIRRITVEDEEIRNHLELVPILLAQAQRIEDDLNNGRETM